jgi:hypothetical protein
MSVQSLLEMAQRLLAPTVAKSEPSKDPDDLPENPDTRATAASPDDAALAAAREEASQGQQASAAAGPEGEGGEPGTAPAPGAPGAAAAPAAAAPKAEEDDEPEIGKAEILASIKFLANAHGLTGEEVAKAFTELEGNPAKGKGPVGKGEELLESIVTGMNAQSKILEAIASAILDLRKDSVSLSGEVAKSLASSEEARKLAEDAATKLQALPRTSPALPVKALEVAKALEGGSGGSSPLTSAQLFTLALEGKMNPLETAAANRRVNYAAPAANN